MKGTSNIHYFITLGVMIAVLVFFFSTLYWMPESRKLKNENYDTTFTLSAYCFKINAAQYDSATQTLRVNYYVKENTPGKSHPPIVKEVTLGDSTGKRLPFTVEKMPEGINPYGHYITISEVPPDEFKFIRVYVEVTDLDVQPPDVLDEFGNWVHPDVRKGMVFLSHASIDHQECSHGISNDTAPIAETVTQLVETELTSAETIFTSIVPMETSSTSAFPVTVTEVTN